MPSAPLSLLLEFSNTLVALAAAGLYLFFKPRDLSGHPFFTVPRWTMLHVVTFFFGLDLAYKAASPLLSVKGSQLDEFTAWLGFQSVGPLWLALLFFVIRPPIRPADFVSPSAGGLLSALRWLCGVLLVVAIAGMVAPSEIVTRAFRLQPHTAGWIYCATLVVAASCAGLVEEVGYRGLLYGALRTRMRPLVAMLLMSACFMLAHGGVNPLAFGMGLLTARMVEKHHSVLPGIILHTGWDLATGIHVWFLGAMKADPHSYFQTVALLTGAALLLIRMVGRRSAHTPPVTVDER